LKRLAAPLLALALAGTALAAPVPAPAKRPNIVLVIADDWGFSDPGSFGSEQATPNLDAVARKGVRLANFHVAASCAPTRAMLLTGVDNHRAGLGNMPETIPPEHQGKPGYGAVLNDKVITLADRFRAGGWRTLYVGKWHLGHGPAGMPDARGFDRSLALSQSGADNFENKPNLLLYDHADWWQDGAPAKLPKRFYSPQLLVDQAMRYIDEQPGKPFFLTLGLLSNHIPVQAPDADIAAYKGRYASGWAALRAARAAGVAREGLLPTGPRVTMNDSPDWASLPPEENARRQRLMEAYAGMTRATDRELGRLIAHLKANGQWENTIFVFVSDNGPEGTDPMATWFPRLNTRINYDTSLAALGRPGSLGAVGPAWASALASPLRGYKFSGWEGGLRVPMFIAGPGVPQGKVARGLAHATDLAPTLLAMAGLPATTPATKLPLEGHDLAPLLAGGSVRGPDEALGYELSGNAALFMGPWKLVQNLRPYGDGRWHLFNIMTDPGETNDRAAAEPARFQAMQAAYQAWAKAHGVLPMPAGYSAPKQIEANALHELLPRRLAPLAGALLALALAWLIGRQWRRRPGA
jgi:arylsulfatase/uncharacterized sulfatase